MWLYKLVTRHDPFSFCGHTIVMIIPGDEHSSAFGHPLGLFAVLARHALLAPFTFFFVHRLLLSFAATVGTTGSGVLLCRFVSVVFVHAGFFSMCFPIFSSPPWYFSLCRGAGEGEKDQGLNVFASHGFSLCFVNDACRGKSFYSCVFNPLRNGVILCYCSW